MCSQCLSNWLHFFRTIRYYPITTRHANYQAICKELLEFSALSSLLQECTDVPVSWEYSQMATREYPQFIANPMGFLLINNCELSKETIDDKYKYLYGYNTNTVLTTFA